MSQMTHPEVVPMSLKILLAHLFGEQSALRMSSAHTASQWRRILERILKELELYMSQNVRTDPLHSEQLERALRSCRAHLGEEDFWPGYVEGLVRFSLLLMGDFPCHNQRKGGRKSTDHYCLSHHRSLCYHQSWTQRFKLLSSAEAHAKLKKPVQEVLLEWRSEQGLSASHKDFLSWYREKYPEEYARVF